MCHTHSWTRRSSVASGSVSPSSDSRAISPWPIGPQTLGPRTLSHRHPKSQGPKGWGPNIPWTSGPWPLGPSDLRCQGLMVWGPKVRGPMGQGLFHCFTSFFHHFLWLADKFPLDNFPPDNSTAIGNLSSLEDVQGEIENLSTWELVHLGTCLPRNLPRGSSPTLHSKGAQKPSK